MVTKNWWNIDNSIVINVLSVRNLTISIQAFKCQLSAVESKHYSINCIVWDNVFSFRQKGYTFIGTALSHLLKINIIQISCMYVY